MLIIQLAAAVLVIWFTLVCLAQAPLLAAILATIAIAYYGGIIAALIAAALWAIAGVIWFLVRLFEALDQADRKRALTKKILNSKTASEMAAPRKLYVKQ